MVVEAEICAAVSDVLTELGFEDFSILVNHREVLEKIMTVQGVDPSQLESAFIVWDKLDKIGVAGARKEWEEAMERVFQVKVLVVRSAPPPKVTPTPAAPRLTSFVMKRLPPLMVVPPV